MRLDGSCAQMGTFPTAEAVQDEMRIEQPTAEQLRKAVDDLACYPMESERDQPFVRFGRVAWNNLHDNIVRFRATGEEGNVAGARLQDRLFDVIAQRSRGADLQTVGNGVQSVRRRKLVGLEGC